MKEREALKLALAALKQIDEAMPFPVAKLAIMKAEEALAQPEQEPVATFDEVWDSIDWDKWRMEPIRELVKMIHSKITPPQRTWAGLTDEEIKIIKTSTPCNDTANCGEAITFGRAIEAKLKEKNT